MPNPRTDPPDLKALKNSQTNFARMANLVYEQLRTSHPEIHRHSRPINLRLAQDDGLDRVVRKIWSTLAEVALVEQLAKDDPVLATQYASRQRSMSRAASQIKRELRAYSAAHPEANLDLVALTHGWSSFKGTTHDLHIPYPEAVDRAIVHPVQRLLATIKWWAK